MAGIIQPYLKKDNPPTLIFMKLSAVIHLAEIERVLFHNPVIYT